MAPGSDCRIRNKSDSPILLIPKSYVDNGAALCGMVRKKLVRVIRPNSFIDVDSRKYDLNRRNCNIQIKIHFVAAEIPTDGGKVHLKQLHDAAYPNGVKVATVEVVLFHYEIKAKGEMFLTCGEGGKVIEVSKEPLIKGTTMTMHQNEEIRVSIPGFFSRFICRKSGHGDYGLLSSVELL
ncbi:hypothetical protein BT93_E1203 [Corymbia citriodora subsp. variegata]|nr:hypothetical protein BT93_E1203 [Corymbia citriodora subsp. variegata]KAF8028508.1 hypothetical protein BT93_E1203 [Corymbia citriodora subsp. variegata]